MIHDSLREIFSINKLSVIQYPSYQNTPDPEPIADFDSGEQALVPDVTEVVPYPVSKEQDVGLYEAGHVFMPEHFVPEHLPIKKQDDFKTLEELLLWMPALILLLFC